MNTISSIDHIYAFEDGDTITPGMGVKWAGGETGLGLQQYWNPTTKSVIATDFAKHPVLLFPQPYSTREGSIVVPETEGQQWYIGNITDDGGILESGAVKDSRKDTFEVTSVEVNGKTFPALKIKANLVKDGDTIADKYIYYKSSYKGKDFVCSQLIPIQMSVGDTLKMICSVEGADGSGDKTLSNDNDWVQLTCYLQRAGINVEGATYQWQRLEEGKWTDVKTVDKMQEASGATLKLYNAGVEGTEIFRCVATYQGNSYNYTTDVSDIHDPYYIEPGRNIASQSVAKGQTVTYNPKVYDRSSGKISDGWTFSYVFTDNDGNVLLDVTKDTLTYENISKHGGIAVRIEATR
ncbi:MAG: hypothetical protein PUF37_05390 [Prevotellaceae bacterium]|nr:hypothetical protein [Prevotellaceae bacterium]